MKIRNHNGFTLIEAIVSIALFMVVMTVATSALISIINANKQTHQVKSAMDNLNFALDSMVRKIRVGSSYQCGAGSGDGTYCHTLAADNDISWISFTSPYDGDNTVVYCLGGTPNCTYGDTLPAGQIWEEIGGGEPIALTDPTVDVTSLYFYVTGAAIGPSDGQPAVVIAAGATAGTGATATSFNLQTSVTQLSYDCYQGDSCY